jgi:hypothetical protein
LVHRWCTQPFLLLIAWIGAFVSLVWCILGPNDPAGRLLIGVTAGVLALAALYGTRARPQLVADPEGIRIGGLHGPVSFAWPQVREVKVVRTRRFGRDVSTLEIETFGPGAQDIGERLHVFGRLELGTDAQEVADVLLALRPPRD